MENFNPTRKCTENEIECNNSYGYKICVEEKIKHVACADYSTELCDDDSVLVKIIITKKWRYSYDHGMKKYDVRYVRNHV